MKLICDFCETVFEGTFDSNCPGCGLVDGLKEWDGREKEVEEEEPEEEPEEDDE